MTAYAVAKNRPRGVERRHEHHAQNHHAGPAQVEQRHRVHEHAAQRRAGHAGAHTARALVGEGLQQQVGVQHVPVEVVHGQQQVDAAAHCQHDAAAHREAHLKGVERRALAEERRAGGVTRRHVPDALLRVVGGAQDEEQHVEIPAAEDPKARLVHGEAGEKGARAVGEHGAPPRARAGVHHGVELAREVRQLAEKRRMLLAVAVAPVKVAGQVGRALRERGHHVEEVHGARRRGRVLARGVGEGRELPAQGEQLGAQRLVDAARRGVLEVVCQAAHAVVQAQARLAPAVPDRARHEQARAQHDAAGREHRRLCAKRRHEVAGAQLQEREEHGVGEVAARVELRRAHEHQRERHGQVHGHAQGDICHRHARAHERQRAHQEEPGVLRRRVVLREPRLEERGERRDREQVLVAKAKLDDPEQGDEEHDDGQRAHELGAPVARPPDDLLARHAPIVTHPSPA